MFRQSLRRLSQSSRRVDSDCIPLEPIWSIKKVTSDLAGEINEAKDLSDEKLLHLHKLSALHPPDVHSVEWKELKQSMLSMVKLVEGVRRIDTGQAKGSLGSALKGKIWPDHDYPKE